MRKIIDPEAHFNSDTNGDITVRGMIAALLMQGLLANGSTCDGTARAAIYHADALITALNAAADVSFVNSVLPDPSPQPGCLKEM